MPPLPLGPSQAGELREPMQGQIPPATTDNRGPMPMAFQTQAPGSGKSGKTLQIGQLVACPQALTFLLWAQG